VSVSSGAAPDPLRLVLRELAAGRPVEPARVTDAFGVVMRGEATAVQTAALLMGLRVQGEDAATIAAVARALRGAMVRLPAGDPASLVDTCGTGGGAIGTFNISTAAALVAAGAGARIAKHGNRSFTSRSGSADVLEALGVRADAPVAAMRRALDEAGIAFMYAPAMHPAMRHVGPVRRELGVPTVMNVVGPLANPAMAGRQVVGVADAARAPLIAGALADLGGVHALVVHGEPGLDEVSPLGPTRVYEVRAGARAAEWVIDPGALGLAAKDAAELAGGEPHENARVVLDVLSGGGRPGARAAVLLNAGAAVYVAGLERTYEAAVERARAALDGGLGMRTLARLRAAYAGA
jgi:anthranilate phosphoribosyltransferase